MLLEQTIAQLDIAETTPARAHELGQLGYMQWLGALPARSLYRDEANRALALALPFAERSTAIAVFCDLLIASEQCPLEPLPLKLPDRHRRGGSQARRRAVL